MSLLPTRPALGSLPPPEHPSLQRRPLSPAEQRARWEVRAAQWRARELAEHVFGRVTHAQLLGVRSTGEPRGLLDLRVPFRDLDLHRAREARFHAAVDLDPLLRRVPLVYVVGPEHG